MSSQCEAAGRSVAGAPIGFFERYLTLWVSLCIVAGTLLGLYAPAAAQAVGALELAHVNIPVGLLIWVMIVPMLMKIDFSSLREVYAHRASMGITLFVNWAVKPFTMALLGWVFIKHLFAAWLPAAELDSYMAGLILLGAAPCTAMVFVWSNLCNGNTRALGYVTALGADVHCDPADHRSGHSDAAASARRRGISSRVDR